MPATHTIPHTIYLPEEELLTDVEAVFSNTLSEYNELKEEFMSYISFKEIIQNLGYDAFYDYFTNYVKDIVDQNYKFIEKKFGKNSKQFLATKKIREILENNFSSLDMDLEEILIRAKHPKPNKLENVIEILKQKVNLLKRGIIWVNRTSLVYPLAKLINAELEKNQGTNDCFKAIGICGIQVMDPDTKRSRVTQFDTGEFHFLVTPFIEKSFDDFDNSQFIFFFNKPPASMLLLEDHEIYYFDTSEEVSMDHLQLFSTSTLYSTDPLPAISESVPEPKSTRPITVTVPQVVPNPIKEPAIFKQNGNFSNPTYIAPIPTGPRQSLPVGQAAQPAANIVKESEEVVAYPLVRKHLEKAIYLTNCSQVFNEYVQGVTKASNNDYLKSKDKNGKLIEVRCPVGKHERVYKKEWVDIFWQKIPATAYESAKLSAKVLEERKFLYVVIYDLIINKFLDENNKPTRLAIYGPDDAQLANSVSSFAAWSPSQVEEEDGIDVVLLPPSNNPPIAGTQPYLPPAAVVPSVPRVVPQKFMPTNYIGILQEEVQKQVRGKAQIQYIVKPVHDIKPTFQATVTVLNGFSEILTADGEPKSSKQEAKRSAAYALMKKYSQYFSCFREASPNEFA